MNPLAESLNETIRSSNPHVLEMLSAQGKRFYYPTKGILPQAAEAKKLGERAFNATIGTALEKGVAMNIPALMEQIPGISPNDALLYAPSFGLPSLRKAWQAKTLHDNPDLAGKSWSVPVVTGGLSHALSTLGDLFVDEGDLLILPQQNWGNYKLNFVERRGAVLSTYPLFANGGFNLDGLDGCLKNAVAEGRTKVILLLNFPNNPTGYTPMESEGMAIAALLKKHASGGLNIVAIVDDAYYGLFFHKEVMQQSLFAKIAGLDPHLLAVKADAATKEVYVWGLRVGFLSFSVGGVEADSPLYEALIAKVGGMIRAVVSNCAALSQYLVAKALGAPAFFAQRAHNVAVIRARAEKVAEVLKNPSFAEAWEPYPFNSGYFMCLKIKKVNAFDLRMHLLKNYKAGTIAISETDLRIAFSSIELDAVEPLFQKIYQAWKDLA